MISKYVLDTAVSATEYDAFVTAQPTCNVLQSSKWAKVKNTWGSKLTALRASDGTIVAAGLVLIRPIKFGYTMWYLPHGPILDGRLFLTDVATNEDLDASSHGEGSRSSDMFWKVGRISSTGTTVLTEYLRQLAAEAKKTKCVMLKVDPPVAVEAAPLDELTHELAPEALAIQKVFEQCGYQHQGFTMHMHETIQPRSFAIVPSPAEGQYEASLPKRTRTFARNARNRYVQVKNGTAGDLDEFMSVINATEQTKGIRLRDRAYFAHLMEIYGDDAHLALAYMRIDEALRAYEQSLHETLTKLNSVQGKSPKKEKALREEESRLNKRIAELKERQDIDGDYATLAGCLLIRHGKTGELLYAGTNRNFGNITAQELLWVEMLGDEFASGAATIGLGGIANSHDDTLTSFKARFNPIIVDKLGEFDYPVRKIMYPVLRWALSHR